MAMEGAEGGDSLPFRVLKNEPRIVTAKTVRMLKKHGASQDLIEAAERAQRTNPPGNGSVRSKAREENAKT